MIDAITSEIKSFLWLVFRCIHGALEPSRAFSEFGDDQVLGWIFINMWVFPKIMVPQKWMIYNGKPHLNMDDLGGFPPIFGLTPMWGCFSIPVSLTPKVWLLPSIKFAFVILRWKLWKRDHNPFPSKSKHYLMLLAKCATPQKNKKIQTSFTWIAPRTASGKRLWSHISTGMVVHFGDLELSGVAEWNQKTTNPAPKWETDLHAFFLLMIADPFYHGMDIIIK